MIHLRRMACALLIGSVAAMALPASTTAQSSRITLSRSVDHAGETLVLADATPDIDAGFPLLSAAVSGGSWQVCSKNGYRGTCVIVVDAVRNFKSEFGFFAKVSSARPWPADGVAAAAAPAAAPIVRAAAPGDVEALFYRLPKAEGRFLPACEDGESMQCGAQRAQRFCQAEGRQGASYFAIRRQGEADVIADLLCTGRPGS